MSTNIIAPVYARIALDIASRIAVGGLPENTRLSGRSVLSSEYGVSPETIRRSTNLLEDVGILEIKHNSGITVVSKAKAEEYVAKFGAHNDLRALKQQLRRTLKEQVEASQKIRELVDVISDLGEKYTSNNPFHNYETEVPEQSAVLGRSLSELKFWQSTGGATIIAIRREGQIILSPGPYTALHPGDVVVYVGAPACIENVKNFLKNPDL